MKKIMAIILVLVMCLSFTGCDFFTVTTDELLSPPQPTGDLYPISQAFKKIAPENYVLKFPTTGENRSAISVEDVDGDGVKEAFVFYATTEDDVISMHLNFIKKKGDKWKSVSDTAITAGDVEKIDFCDLNGDGKKEILVGWQIYGNSEKKIGVYSVEKETLTERFLSLYTTFICCYLENDGKNSLFVQHLNQNEHTNTASLYTLKKDGVIQTAGCLLDSNVKSVSSLTLSSLKGGKKAVFVDEIKGLGAVSEVLFLKDNELVNPLLNKEKLENEITLRNSNIKCTDINGDGRLEIPTAVTMPAVDGGEEKFYYTNWCSFDGENMEIAKVTYFNTSDGYYLEIDSNLTGRLAIKKDSERKERTFYLYDSQSEMFGKKLFTVYAFAKKDADKKLKSEKGLFKITETKATVFAADTNETSGDISVSRKQIKEMFKLIK